MPSTPSRRDRQMVRILSLLGTLLEGGKPSVHQLASRFRTRRETIYRDLRTLSAAGYPIVGDENGRLSHPRLLTKDPRGLPQLQLTEEEVTALIWAASEQGTRQPFGKALPSASSKLRAMASAKLLPRELDQTITRRNRGKKDYSHHQSAILQLVEAIIRRRTCRVTYQSPGQ